MDSDQDVMLLRLPGVVLRKIGDYLDVLSLAHLCGAYQHFQQFASPPRNIKISFCDYTQEQAMAIIKVFSDSILSLDVNNGSFLRRDALSLVMKLYKLQELHITDSNLRRFFEEVPADLPPNLKSFSFRWDDRLYDLWKSQAAFQSVTDLTICYYGRQPFRFTNFARILSFVLENCPNVEKLRIYNPYSVCCYESQDDDTVQGSERLLDMLCGGACLPRLSEFHLDVHINRLCYTSLRDAYTVVIGTFLKNHNGLTKVYLGQLSWHFLEFNFDHVNQLLPLLANETTEKICLDSYQRNDWRSASTLPAIPKVWDNRATPFCKSVSMRNLFLPELETVAFIMVHNCVALRELDLSEADVERLELSKAMRVFSDYFLDLTHLNLAVLELGSLHPLACDDVCYSISLFTELKVLHLNSLLIEHLAIDKSKFVEWSEFEESLEQPVKVVGDEDYFYKVTVGCSKLEEFYLVDYSNYDDKFRQADDNILASISNWTRLKKLHLVNIATFALFMDKVFINNEQLEEFHIGSHLYSTFDGELCSRNLEIFLKHLDLAKALKRLSIVKFTGFLLGDLLDCVRNCSNLELLESTFYGNGVYIPRLVADVDQLLRLPKLRFLGGHRFPDYKLPLLNLIRHMAEVRPELKISFLRGKKDFLVPRVFHRYHFVYDLAEHLFLLLRHRYIHFGSILY